MVENYEFYTPLRRNP